MGFETSEAFSLRMRDDGRKLNRVVADLIRSTRRDLTAQRTARTRDRTSRRRLAGAPN